MPFHEGPTFGDPSKALHPSAALPFVMALLLMLAAFTLVWVYLLIRRYELARLEWRIEDDVRRGRVDAARLRAVLERAVAAVHEQRIVPVEERVPHARRDEEVDAAVLVEVGRRDAPRPENQLNSCRGDSSRPPKRDLSGSTLTRDRLPV